MPLCVLSSGCRHTRCWGCSWGCSEIRRSLHCWGSERPGSDPGSTIYTSTWQPETEWKMMSGNYMSGWRAGRGWQCTSLWDTGLRWPWQTLKQKETKKKQTFAIRPRCLLGVADNKQHFFTASITESGGNDSLSVVWPLQGYIMAATHTSH